MGSYMSCIVSNPPTSTIDMSGLQNKNLPMIWITGAPNSGKKTIGRLIRNKYEFEYINITDLLREEVEKDSNRAVIVKKHLNAQKKVPDYIVMELLKESLLNSTTDKGFVISNFPKTVKQAEAFTREIGNVNFVYYLYAGFPLLIDRAQRKSAVPLDHDVLRRKISITTREIKTCLGKFVLKIESINTSGLPEETFPKVESALIRRINIVRPIITETDYVQAQKTSSQNNEQRQNTSSTDNINPEEESNSDKPESEQNEVNEPKKSLPDNTVQGIEEKEENKDVQNEKEELKDNMDETITDVAIKVTEYEEREIKFTELNQNSFL